MQERAIAVTQELATAETQEPSSDIVTEIKESDAQGSTKLLSLHQEAKTQESVVDPMAALQELASVAMTITQ
jgi:hypothetical protein